MFTGIVETTGTLSRIGPRAEGVEVVVEAPFTAELSRGESVAVDGCCLTVERFDDRSFTLFASPETLRKTSLGDRRAGDLVNLERAMVLGGRLGGHLVQGHVDATGHFRSARQTGDSWEVWIEAPPLITEQSIPKGSITVDGISLTIVDLTADAFSLWIIPETWKVTSLSRRSAGDRVNLEADLIGKYVRKFLETSGAGARPRLEEIAEKFHSG